MKRNNFKEKTDVFFDLDHTLWDFERNSALAFDKVIQELALPFSSKEFLEFYVPINEKYWEWYSGNFVSREQLRVGRVSDTFDALKYRSTQQEIDNVILLYLRYLPEFNHLLAGAHELLEYLTPKYRLHIITNGFSEVQRHKLSNASIADYFITITDSENAGSKKPNADIFNYALSSAGTNAKNSVMIGDNLIADVQGALDVGMDIIYYNEFKKPVPFDVVEVSELIQIQTLL